MDVVGDFLTIIRNASAARKASSDAQWSNLREGIAKILKAEGFIKNYEVITINENRKTLRVFYKYVGAVPGVTEIKRISKPGCRIYSTCAEIAKVLGGLGIAIVSTSTGLLTDKAARSAGVGGEVLCHVW